MFFTKKINELTSQLEAITGEFSTASAKVLELTEANAAQLTEIESLKGLIADYESQVNDLEAKHKVALETVKTNAEAEVEQKVAEGVITLAASVGVEPIAHNPQAEVATDISEQLSQITDPVERARFISANQSELIKAAAAR